MSSVGQLLREARQRIIDASESSQLDSELLLSHVLQCDRKRLIGWPETEVMPEQEAEFMQLIERREAGEPIAYLLKSSGFWTLTLEVDNSTLIPRPDTERLVEVALELPLPPNSIVIDLGCGTGAIALALATERPDWMVLAVDRIPDAVALAERNRQRLELNNVRIMTSDWFSAVGEDAKFDLIVSNPPYIDVQDTHLQQGDLRFEPVTALVAGQQGLLDLYEIIEQAFSYLNLQGWLVLEHGYQQHEQVAQKMRETGYDCVQSFRDYGQNWRVTIGQRTQS